MSNRKRWSRLEEAEFIMEQCAEILTLIPVGALRREYNWVPSDETLDLVEEALDRINRYSKRNKVNGWKEHHGQ